MTRVSKIASQPSQPAKANMVILDFNVKLWIGDIGKTSLMEIDIV